jgi:4-hydroxy-tetrahydrodipicolinate synthase
MTEDDRVAEGAARNGAVTNHRWTWDQALCGVIPPMISPLDQQQRVDEAAIDRVVEYLLDGGCSGLFVLGGVGVGSWLNSEQRQAVVRATVRAVAGRAPVLVGLMLPSTAPTRDAALQAADVGADALVVGSPYYFGADGASQRRHVEAILAATSLPVLLYNIPQCTHVPLAHEMVAGLSSEPRVLGVKDSWGELPYFQSLLTLKQARPSFRVLQGNELSASASLLLGADGLIPGHGNLAPRPFVDLVDAARGGDRDTCQRLHDQIVRLTSVFSGYGMPGLYAACGLAGLSSGIPPEPWAPLEPSQLESIKATLRANDLLPAVPA